MDATTDATTMEAPMRYSVTVQDWSGDDGTDGFVPDDVETREFSDPAAARAYVLGLPSPGDCYVTLWGPRDPECPECGEVIEKQVSGNEVEASPDALEV